MSLYLGIDLGTSSIKGLVINSQGKILASFAKDTPLISRQSNWAEQSPEFWWSSVLEIINLLATKIDIKKVASIGLSGQMHGLVTYDQKYSILRRAIIWMDQRSTKQVEQILKLVPHLYQITGNPVFPGFLLPSLLWLKKNEPGIYKQIFKVSSPKDYFAYKLTEVLRTEPTDALATAAFDYKKNSWSKKIISTCKLKLFLFPEVQPTTKAYGGITSKVAKLTGLITGTPVYGASDQAMSAMGTGLVKPKQASIAISTGGQFLVIAPTKIIDPKKRLHTLNHALPNIGLYMAATLSAGFSLSWFKNKITQQKNLPFDKFSKGIHHINPGSDNLIFLPYLSGERTPYFNSKLRGAFIGLSLTHQKIHLVRAIIEGVSFSMKQCLEVFQELKLPINKVILSGGGAKNPIWRQILCDVLNLPMTTINIEDHSPFGAAVFAKFALEGFDQLPQFYKKVIKPIDYLYPHEKNAKQYDKLFQTYKQIAQFINKHQV